MNPIVVHLLQQARRVAVGRLAPSANKPGLRLDHEGQAASDLIRALLLAPAPCMITRFGGNELSTIIRYRSQRQRGTVANAWRFIRGKQGPFWWDNKIRERMRIFAGLFPSTDEQLVRFAERNLRDVAHADVLGSWLPEEIEIAGYFPRAKIVPLKDIEPYYHNDPWTTALAGRTVLVIHPFEASIRRQYAKRGLLFADQRILPEFSLITLKAVQSSRGSQCGFESFFEALDWMCERVRETEFDVALIGAGAYGLPLAAFVKGIGRKAVHIGGATQIMFGIRGRRWDRWPFYQRLFNEHWTRPLSSETPGQYVGTIRKLSSYW